MPKLPTIIGILILVLLVVGGFYFGFQQVLQEECSRVDITELCSTKVQCEGALANEGIPQSEINQLKINCDNGCTFLPNECQIGEFQ